MNAEGASPDELTSETWNRLEDLLEEVLARPESERHAYLDAACAGKVTLRRQIESLIAAHDQTDSPLDRIGRTLAGQSPDESPEWNGRTLGAYELVREIGRGGMGVVFLARRNDGQYERDVALKVIRSPLHDARERRRLVAERQTLARLSHPGIAQLYDGGVTSDGLPYFTMEYVSGRPIDRYCDERGLDVVARVQLFLQACDAVAAAHRSLVVHRDLKPAHVLVTPDGVVKLLDFGIAKHIEPSASAPVTRPGVGPFTPDYASPEQVRGEAITTTSDVYALGAILYQLLTGIRPHRFESKSPADIQRAICDEEPVRPSVALAQSREAAAGRGSWLTRAGRSRTERRLRGDLDTILIKALHKDPTRRYESVDLFRQDLANHLGGRPVNARPDGWAYRARKFAVRHRVGVSAALLILISLVAGVAATKQQARHARQQSAVAAIERERAKAEAARVKRVSSLLTDIFRLANPGQSNGETITARELLDRGTRRVESELAGDAETQAAVLQAISQVYGNLALYEPADRLMTRVLSLRTTLNGASSVEVAESLNNFALLNFERGQYADAERRFREALAIRWQQLDKPNGVTGAAVADTLDGLGQTLSEAGRPAEAEIFLRDALQLRRQARDAAAETATLNALAMALHRKGDTTEGEKLFRQAVERGRQPGETATPARVHSIVALARLLYMSHRDVRGAEALYREALALARRIYPDDHPDVATCSSELARTLRDQGNLSDAEALTRESLATWQRLYGPRNREVMISTQTLAGLLARRGKPRDAEPLFREALSMGREIFGRSNPLVLSAQSALATFLEDQRRWSEALSLRQNEVAVAMEAFGDKHVQTARASTALATHQLARGRLMKAEASFRRALRIRERTHPAGHWRIAEAKVNLGRCLLQARRYTDAAPFLREAVESLRGNADAPPDQVKNALTNIIGLYESLGRPEEASRYRLARASGG